MRNAATLFPALLALVAFAASGWAQSRGLAGEWVSINERTRGLTRVVIAAEDDGLTVEVWERCHPTDCEWGKRTLGPFTSESVDRRFAWMPVNATTHLIFSIDRRMLLVETVTLLPHRSKRPSYRKSEYFRRAHRTMR